MKKIVIIVISILLLVGCSCSLMQTPTSKTKEFLDDYKNLSDDVLSDLDLSAEAEGLSEKNTKLYKDVLKRQYQDLKYEIKDEKVEGNDAIVTVKITVYDLFKAAKQADNYLEDNPEKFQDDNKAYDEDSFMKYKLNKMKETEETVEYTIDFQLVKVDNDWVVQQPDTIVKEKIHGLYDYED